MFVASIDKNEGDYYSARRIIIMYKMQSRRKS